MKTELFEKMIRKIVREELDFYASKIIKEMTEVTSQRMVIENKNSSNTNSKVNPSYTTTLEHNITQPTTATLRESLMGFKNELDREYGMESNSAKMQFDGMEVPPELDAVFNKNYSDFMKKITK
jgi:hypothetical protein